MLWQYFVKKSCQFSYYSFIHSFIHSFILLPLLQPQTLPLSLFTTLFIPSLFPTHTPASLVLTAYHDLYYLLPYSIPVHTSPCPTLDLTPVPAVMSVYNIVYSLPLYPYPYPYVYTIPGSLALQDSPCWGEPIFTPTLPLALALFPFIPFLGPLPFRTLPAWANLSLPLPCP